MDTISLRQSERIMNRVTKNELRNMNRKGATATSVCCEGNKNFNNQTTSLISALPEEFLVEILSRLPPKSFFRCRSVCKYWLSLSSEAFGRNKHLQPTVHGLFHNGGSFSSFSYVSFGFNNVNSDGGKISALSCLKYIWVHDCCNGLVLLSAQSKIQPLIDLVEIYVYNPATESLSSLGPISMFRSTIFSLAFDSRAPSLLHLICFSRCEKEGESLDRADIFSFGGGNCKCKQGKELAPDTEVDYDSKGTFLDGRVHRLTTQNKILSIDPNKCSYEVICLPDLENLTFAKIGQSQGLLNCMTVCNNITLCIWVLKSYSRQEWTMKYQLNLDQIYSVRHLDEFDVCNQMKYADNFAFHPQKDVLFLPLGFSGILAFDLSTTKTEEHYHFSGNKLFGFWVCMRFYSI